MNCVRRLVAEGVTAREPVLGVRLLRSAEDREGYLTNQRPVLRPVLTNKKLTYLTPLETEAGGGGSLVMVMAPDLTAAMDLGEGEGVIRKPLSRSG